MSGEKFETKLGEIEAQLPGGILLLHTENRAEQAAKFQQEVSDMGIFVARQGQLTNIAEEKLIHLVDTARLILFLPDETLDRPTSDLLEHIIRTRSGYAQVLLTKEDKRDRRIILLADRELDWTSETEKERLARTFRK